MSGSSKRSNSAKTKISTECGVSVSEKRLCVVQFPHPGGEYPILLGRSANAKRRGDDRIDVFWNTKEHHRRLVRHCGEYVDAQGVFHKRGDLCFWTEWEAETIATEIGSEGNPLIAQYMHEVKYPRKPLLSERGKGCQDSGSPANTDPCVIGRTFKYCYCRQNSDGAWLRHLLPGSLVVFWSQRNSTKGQHFCLDTVLIVGNEAKDYVTGNAASINCSPEYRNLTLDRLPVGYDATFYRGVAYDEKVGKPVFSFVPAKIYGHKDHKKRCVFENADIKRLNAIIEKDVGKELFNARSVRRSCAVEVRVGCVKSLWTAIKEIVISKEFVLGVHFDWPKNTQGGGYV